MARRALGTPRLQGAGGASRQWALNRNSVTEEEVVGRGLLFAGSTAPAWKLIDAAGKEHELAQYRGKIVVLDFWATWRRPCLKAMPDLQKLHERYRDRGVVVLGLATNDDHQLAAG
jgi:thiol-disulfide isomerase/thioredoxin